MADAGIKKVIVTKDTTGVVGPNNTHVLRYRIVSEDKNRFSAWSPVYSISGNTITVVDGDINIVGNTVLASWGDEILRPGYDVFVGYGSLTPEYHGTTAIHTYSFLKTGNTPRVVVQVSSINKQLDESLEIYDSAEDLEGDII
jgi:hypothetical protein